MKVYQWRKALVVAAIFGLIGLALVVITRAATSTTSLESELGSQTSCAVDVNDTSASAGKAVMFTACGLGGPMALDKTGKTIPDTNYSIPAGAIYLATNGNDSNNGTSTGTPVKTLNRAITLVPEGGTIVVRGGTYHDWYNTDGAGIKISSKGMTIQAYPHEQPWFDGADVVADGWASDGAGHWRRNWSTPQFCDGKYYQYHPLNQPFDKANSSTYNKGPCSHGDVDSSSVEPTVGDPQMVWVNGTELRQVESLSKVTATSFYYDWDNRQMYLGTNPSGKTVELSVRPTALVMGGTDVSPRRLKGLGFKRYASNEYSNLTGGAVYIGGSSIIEIESVVVTQGAGKGVALSSPYDGSSIRNSVFAYNGIDGFTANGSATTGGNRGRVNNLLIEGNVFYSNNFKNFGHECSASCGSAHIKMANMNKYTFKNNYLDTIGLGSAVWCDTRCYDGITVNNLIVGGGDIFYEMVKGGFIASNVIVGSQYGINVLAEDVRVYNNTIIDAKTIAMRVFDDDRTEFNAQNVQLFNNISYGQPTNVNWFVNQGTVGPTTFITGFDYNSYWRERSSTIYRWIDSPSSETSTNSATAFRAIRPNMEVHAQDFVGGSDPFFVNKAGGDYRVRSNSQAYNSGGPLPADIAQALGVPTSAGQTRGAFNWPGKQ